MLSVVFDSIDLTLLFEREGSQTATGFVLFSDNAVDSTNDVWCELVIKVQILTLNVPLIFV